MGWYDPEKDVKGEEYDRNAALKEVINNIVSFINKLR